MHMQSFPFSEQQLEELESILFKSDTNQDTLDLFGIHGMICAFIIGPVSVPQADWISHIIDEENNLSSADNRLVTKSLKTLATHLLAQVNTGQPIEMPSEIYEDENALTNWCAGFIEGYLINEKAWFSHHEEEGVAGLLMPIMVHSGFYINDDFQDILQNDQLMAQMATEIADNLLDLYVLYRT